MNRHFLLIAATTLGLTLPSHASLVAWYRFDEDEDATIALNSVPGSSVGAISGGVFPGMPGISGNAYLFDDGSGFVDMGDANFFPSINTSQQLTFSAWVKTSVSVGTRNVVVFAGNDTVNDRYADLGYSGTGDASSGIDPGAAYARNRAAGNGVNTTSGIPINDDEWHQLVMTIDLTAESDQLRLYVDGELFGVQTLSGASLAFPTFNNFEVGRLGRSSPTDYYGGFIDDVQVYDTALSESDILFLYENPGQAVPEPGTFVLAGIGLGVLCLFLRRKTRA